MEIGNGTDGVKKYFGTCLGREVRGNVINTVCDLTGSAQRLEPDLELPLILKTRETTYKNWIITLRRNNSGKLEVVAAQGTENNDGTIDDHLITITLDKTGNLEAKHIKGTGLYEKTLNEIT